MRNRNKVITYSIFFAIGTLLGLMFQMFKVTSINELNAANPREPQSIDKKAENLDVKINRPLEMAERDNLINSVEIQKREHNIDIVLGSKIFTNEAFDTTRIEFEAQGVAVSGETPTFVVQAPTTHLIHIPLQEILRGKSVDSEMTFKSGSQSIKISFKDMPPQWPNDWNLKKISLSHSSKSAPKFEVSNFEVGMGHRNQIVMRW